MTNSRHVKKTEKKLDCIVEQNKRPEVLKEERKGKKINGADETIFTLKKLFVLLKILFMLTAVFRKQLVNLVNWQHIESHWYILTYLIFFSETNSIEFPKHRFDSITINL